ncbi:MAG: LysR family transcriptional regulator [Clostridia bacterium]|nr:LysR family transcriptional regulator [Clostridia bacterium]NCC69876.1 LysR family transcriptional regulator [Clostridia bacterium]
MELEKIKIFAVVAECGSFKKAADRLYVSHSTVSRAVSALERELGTFLFMRDCRGVKPTEAGKEFLEGGKKLIAEAEALERRIAEKGEKICTDTAKP